VSKPDNRKNRNEIISLRDNAPARLERRGVLFSYASTVDLSGIFLLNNSIRKLPVAFF